MIIIMFRKSISYKSLIIISEKKSFQLQSSWAAVAHELALLQNFQTLAASLPYAKHMHSRLICAITKELMDENNPPMVLPSGTVYSEKAVQQHAKQGQFVDPATGEDRDCTSTRMLHYDL